MKRLRKGYRCYAYEQLPDGGTDCQAFYDMLSALEWVQESDDRHLVHRSDLSKPEIRMALWWTDTKIGAING